MKSRTWHQLWLPKRVSKREQKEADKIAHDLRYSWRLITYSFMMMFVTAVKLLLCILFIAMCIHFLDAVCGVFTP